MLITRAQGAACRLAAERIAEFYMGPRSHIGFGILEACALDSIGWAPGVKEGRFDGGATTLKAKSQVLMALLWCAEIAGSE